MSKKHKYNRKKKDIKQEILRELVNCQSSCGSLGCEKKENSREDLDYVLENLPGVDYVVSRMLNYIFSNGLTTGDNEKDKVLDEWLYATRNSQGASNYHVLRQAIQGAAVYGECGLRLYNGNLYTYKKGTYGLLVDSNEGIDSVIGYFIRKDGKAIDETFYTDHFSEYDTINKILDYFEDNGMVFLSEEEFRNIRNDTSSLHGYCPFTRDKQRIDLLLSTYERMNYDIEYDGPGRIIVRPKDGYVEGDENDVSTGSVLQESIKDGYDQARKEVQRVAKEIKDSTSDSVIALSNAFSDKITHLPRVTKSTEFFNWQSNEGVILAEIMGMSPTLLEVGHISGNVSVEKIIDNGMLNTIIPMRENYAVQFSDLISNALGFPKVYFNKYDLQQVEDENIVRHKVAEIIRNLSVAYKNSAYEDKVVLKAIEDFTTYLNNSIYTDRGDLIHL